ncbi:MAG: CHAT domain-containing protein [Chloroflexia bacterium]
MGGGGPRAGVATRPRGGHRDGLPFGDARMRVAAPRELAGELAVLHLATHAAFESDDFLQSHIVFHGGERLTLGELFSDPRLDLRGMRLCYLSACSADARG